MEILSFCPICNGREFKDFLSTKDFTVTREIFNIIECSACSFKFTNPRPEEAEIGRYYESEDYISHSKTNKGIINQLYHLVKIRSIQHKIQIIENLYPNGNKILDIGCGTGDFLGEIKKKNWIVAGIEPNEKAKKSANETFNISVYDESYLSMPLIEPFSIITMWHVLEHVHHLKNRVLEIFQLLKSGGHAIIAVPNHNSWDANHYKNFWAAYDVPRHLSHFSAEVIKKLFQQQGFEFEKSLPMKMDSYYVSMLSEKYRNSNFQLIRAVCNGFISNYKANNDAEKYSSVIYIFKKN
jgi:2-polyprenyl-3-methyl-5-hydroxy-6-metoxy-1,4-benzoquinol methylase